MSGFWRGYANVNDDVRHTYEQVFYGRQTTGNLTESEVPGMKEPGGSYMERALPADPAAPQGTVPAATPDAFGGLTTTPGMRPEVAEVYGNIWGNASTNQGSALETYHQAMLTQQGGGSPQAGYPQLEPPTIEGTTGGPPGGAPQIEAPKIEPPAQAAPNQGDDMTPGY